MIKTNKKGSLIDQMRTLINKGNINGALNLAGNDIELLAELGISFVQEQNHTVIEKIYDRIMQIHPKSHTGWVRIGNAVSKLNKLEEAISCYQKAINSNPENCSAWSNLGEIFGRLKEYNEAIKCFNEALKIEPTCFITWAYKGDLLTELKQYHQAIECFDRALAIEPEVAEVWYNKAIALNLVGKTTDAINCVKKAQFLNQDNPLLAKDLDDLLQKMENHNNNFNTSSGSLLDELKKRVIRFYIAIRRGLKKQDIKMPGCRTDRR